ncbi:MAG: dihydrofolate reductase family protein [Gemmatimonadota bacterium]
MRKLAVFNQLSLDAYFTDNRGDMSWAHKGHDDKEWNDFVAGNAKGEGELVFGRVTYQMMASYWPGPQAAKDAPAVAEGMNNLPKVVFSRTLTSVSWKNTRLIKGDLVTETRKLKNEPGNDLVILGSGSIVAQLAEAGLIDEYQLIVNPLVLGQGRTLFEGLSRRLNMALTESRAFGNGNVLLRYEPKK